MAAEIHAQRPAVVVNTVGPFGATADAIAAPSSSPRPVPS
jgi:short subunit dehydrogenase-like uncharacterized protein